MWWLKLQWQLWSNLEDKSHMPRTADQKDKSGLGCCRDSIQCYTAYCGLLLCERMCITVLFKSMLFQVFSLATKCNSNRSDRTFGTLHTPNKCVDAQQQIFIAMINIDWACSAHSSVMSKSIWEAISFSLQVGGPHNDYIRVTWEAFETLMPRTTSWERLSGLGPRPQYFLNLPEHSNV